MAIEGTSRTDKADLKIGSYRLLQSLGAGGMSSVFRAIHTETGLEVALKVLPRAFAKNPTTVQRFLREAKSAESLEHPGIVAIYDRGVDEGRHYLVLEYVAGGDLHDRIRNHGPMSAADAVAVIRSVALSLKYAETQGLIHRDIKPANILLTSDNRAKVADLGLALQSENEDERVTREGTTVGTVDYMAPEQARDSRGTSIKSDMYSLGCTFYFLLTGQPPYPTGDVADKLARHCTAPIPNPSDFRGDLSTELSGLVMKMMAKRPEHRFENYDALVNALDTIPLTNDFHPLSSTLIQPASPLFALIEDDGSSDSHHRPVSLRKPAIESPSDSSIPLVDLSAAGIADLADAEDLVRPTPPRAGPPQVLPRLRAEIEVEPDSETFDEPSSDTELPSVADESVVTAAPRPDGRGRMPEGDRTWILTCVLIGLTLLLVIIGGDQLFRGGGSRNEDLIINAIEGLSEGSEPLANNNFENAVVVRQPEIKHSVAKEKPAAPENAEVEAPAAWTEPTDPIVEIHPEPDYGLANDERFVPVAVRGPAAIPVDAKVVRLNRLADPRDPDAKSTLKRALEVAAALVIEVNDNGPFFEGDLKFVGDRRVIRGAKGFRPIIVVEPPRGDPATGQGAYFDLVEKDLTFEGVDLVVDAGSGAARARALQSLFSMAGGSVTLRNCTLTVVNRSNQPLAIVKTGPSPRPSRIMIDGTILRGTFSQVIDLGSGPVDATIVRSLVFNRLGGVIAETGVGAGPPDRVVRLIRSIFATGGSAITRPPGADDRKGRKKVVVRALGSTFANFQGPEPPSFIACSSDVNPSDFLDWFGDANEFQGFRGWMSTGRKNAVKVPGLADVRQIWQKTDPGSFENPLPWPSPPGPETVVPAHLYGFAGNRLATLDRLPVPSPTLFEQTLDSFPKPVEPQTGTNFGDPGRIKPINATSAETHFSEGTNRFNVGPQTKTAPNSSAKPAGVRELVFDTDQPNDGGGGDLGLFLASNLKPGDKAVKVRVQGFGEHEFTPYRVPDGLGLEIVVEPRPGGIVPGWRIVFGEAGVSQGAALEARGGYVALTGVRLSKNGRQQLRSLVKVDHGHLLLDRCRLTEFGKGEETSDAPVSLIEFNASGSQPIEPSATTPFAESVDRPVCRIADSVLKADGRVFTSQIGRGLMIVRGSVLISSDTLFALEPSKAAKGRLFADLVLERCTFAAERAFVELGPWPGNPPGPDRPIVVHSGGCAYFGTFDKEVKESALLRADPGGLASGGLFWQANGDDYEVPNFIASTTSRPQNTGATAKRLDVRWQWAEVWGAPHARNVSGPRNGGPPALRLFAKLKPGEVEPGDLYIDYEHSPIKAIDNGFGADLAKLGITPSPLPVKRR